MKMHKDGGRFAPPPDPGTFPSKGPHRNAGFAREGVPDRDLRFVLHAWGKFVSAFRSFWYRYRKRVAALPASLVPWYCPIFCGDLSWVIGRCSYPDELRSLRSLRSSLVPLIGRCPSRSYPSCWDNLWRAEGGVIARLRPCCAYEPGQVMLIV
jgi:hypothetical protein